MAQAGGALKIALIGAGSATFSRTLVTDLLSGPELAGCEIALMDVDPARLALVEALARAIAARGRSEARVTATLDRAQALEGAAYVVTTLAVGFAYERERPDVAIPRRYGLHQTSADAINVGGVFRYLRTMPALLAVGRDMQRLCPDALWLNYVNPMNMIMWTIARLLPDVRAVGLCHSVQGTARRLAGYAGVPPDEVSYWAAGINHQAWYLEFRHDAYGGEDLYPKLRAAANDPALYAQDRVRFEVMRHFGYFVTESSRHMSEFVPWFRRTETDRERYTPETMASERAAAAAGFPVARAGYLGTLDVPAPSAPRAAIWDEIERQITGRQPIDLQRSREYCTHIIRAIETNSPFRFNGNVPNTGLITNLPPGCNVEVPILADSAGLRPCYVGDLPSQLAAINRTNVNVQELAVDGFLKRDKDAVFQAAAMDPLGGATVGLDDTRQMVEELFEANARWLDDYEARARPASTLPPRRSPSTTPSIA